MVGLMRVRVTQALIQNEILDIYEDDFAGLMEEDLILGNKSESLKVTIRISY